MKRLSLLTLVFAVFSMVFFLLLIFFRTPFVLYPLMSYQDVLDLLTPLVLIPLYWILFKHAASQETNLKEEVLFLLLAVLWIAGQGMHLSANSINNLIDNLARQHVIDVAGTGIYHLVYFYDEYLSHFLWHIGVVGLAALLIYREWRGPAGIATNWWAAVSGGVIYGFTCFCFFLEGQTLILGLPFTLVITILTLIWGRKRIVQQPILAFFFVSSLVAVILFGSWGIYWGGFPQFSDVGLI